MPFAAFASLVRPASFRRAAAGLAGGFVLVSSLTAIILLLAWPEAPVHVHLRWTQGTPEAERVALERRFRLTEGVHTGGTTWEYQLTDASTANIRAIVEDTRVDDTNHLNRIRYRPEFAQDRWRQIPVYSVALGGVGSILLVTLGAAFWRTDAFPRSIPGLRDAMASMLGPASAPAVIAQSSPVIARQAAVTAAASAVAPHPWRAAVAVAAAVMLAAAGISSFAHASIWSVAAALIVVYAGGYVAGSLLVSAADGLSLAVIRTIAGFLLTTVAFLLSLVLGLPWFAGPVAVTAAAVFLRRRLAFAWPRLIRFGADEAIAAAAAAVILSPILISFVYMAPGAFPPVFYNVDIAYFMEKVHALVAADSYPPSSLSNVGVRGTYHYGTQAMAALISRSSGLLPHHALFLLVLPLLAGGVMAAAFAAARHLAPAVPRSVAVPLLLVSTPSLAIPLWAAAGPRLSTAIATGNLSIDSLLGDYRIWGILSNEGQNVGGDVLVLGSIAGIGAAAAWGWMLPAFLIGTAVLVKTPIGFALIAGFGLAEAWRALAGRRAWPTPPLVLAAAVFAVTVLAFFVTSLESKYHLEVFPLFHLGEIAASGAAAGVAADVLWLFLPALIVLTAGIGDPERRSAPLLCMALAPILVVNTTRLATDGGGSGGDWMQVLHPVPFMLHAFALSLAGRRWNRLGSGRRAAFLSMAALVAAPVVVAAAGYSRQILRDPASGHEFVDNRAIAEALAVIPTEGTVVVTNDLRYPAENFSRDYRQMQIPALFGHQAFAANYAYESVDQERRHLQDLLQRPEWSDDILQAARAHRWTHFLVRKDYVHPRPVPLEQIFENGPYAVFRFEPPGLDAPAAR